jgi:UDP-sugar diphosphatase
MQLPAGLVDKRGKSLEEIACEECFEEAGYRVNPANMQKIQTVFGSVGLQASALTLFYAEVTQQDAVPGAGGGLREQGEFIDVIHLPCTQIAALLEQAEYPLPTGLWAALEWFMQRQSRAEQQRLVAYTWALSSVALGMGVALGIIAQRWASRGAMK